MVSTPPIIIKMLKNINKVNLCVHAIEEKIMPSMHMKSP